MSTIYQELNNVIHMCANFNLTSFTNISENHEWDNVRKLSKYHSRIYSFRELFNKDNML